ncbi:unnamed protein product [Schistocephalus solidus]|uniref:Reverse transcriptase domain-containing protein n=1 Tax=Schistocephalus solidus TaxID=70667 RepID=A0A183SG70_SCHSO|nr:unnamed protein product [Schistocephalus solidus]
MIMLLDFSNQITEKLEDLHAPDDNATVARWCQLRKVIQSTALDVLRRARRQHQDCFDDNDADISNLLTKKNGLRKAYMDLRIDATKATFFRCRRLVRQRLWEMKDALMIQKAEEIQEPSTAHVSSGPHRCSALTDKFQILKRWAEHFRSILICSSAISDAAMDRLPQMDTNNDLDLPPSLLETIRAVQQISSGKAPGSDAISPEVYKHGGPRLMAELTKLFQEMWCHGQVPQDFKDATIVHLYKRKGNRQLIDNHRGISLLNITGKVFVRILLNRLNGHLEQVLLPESQCDFRRHRETTFMDITKAFDTVNHDGLWKSCRNFAVLSGSRTWCVSFMTG